MRPTTRTLPAALAVAALLASACGGAEPGPLTTTAAQQDTATEDEPAGTDAPAGEDAGTDEADGADTADTATSDGEAEDGTTTDANAERPEASAEAIAALDFTTVDLDGRAFVGREYAGQDVMLWIWAPWCSVCNREAPKIRPVLDARKDDLVLLGLPGKDSLAAHHEFVDEHDLDFLRHIVDQDGSIWTRYGVGYQPAFVFIDDSGEVSVHAGAIGAEALEARLADLLAT